MSLLIEGTKSEDNQARECFLPPDHFLGQSSEVCGTKSEDNQARDVQRIYKYK